MPQRGPFDFDRTESTLSDIEERITKKGLISLRKRLLCRERIKTRGTIFSCCAERRGKRSKREKWFLWEESPDLSSPHRASPPSEKKRKG